MKLTDLFIDLTTLLNLEYIAKDSNDTFLKDNVKKLGEMLIVHNLKVLKRIEWYRSHKK